MATTKVKPYNFEEFKVACEQHNNEVKSASKGVKFRVDVCDETEVRLIGVCHELTYEDLAFYYVWADDGTHCGKTQEPDPGPVPEPIAAALTETRQFYEEHRSQFAIVPIDEDTFKRVQVCGYHGVSIIIGFRDATGLYTGFTDRVAALDRNTTFSASYDLVSADHLRIVSINP